MMIDLQFIEGSVLCHIFSSHLVTHHVTSYFVYYFVQVLFRGLLPFRTMSPFIFRYFVYVSLAYPSLYLSSHSVPSHCCLPWLHLSFLRALVTWLHFCVTVDTILPYSSVTVYKGHLVLLCSLVCNLVLLLTSEIYLCQISFKIKDIKFLLVKA